MNRILVVEGDAEHRRQLCRFLIDGGFGVVEATSFDTAAPASFHEAEVVVAGTATSLGPEPETISHAADVPVVVVAGDATIAGAVASVRAGAADYIPRPYAADTLLAAVYAALKSRTRTQRRKPPRAAAKSVAGGTTPEMIGTSEAMCEVFDRIGKVAPTDSTVLIHGESGTGKELVARALHSLSTRREATMVSLNCAAIPDALIEPELFGHAPGALASDGAGRGGLIEAADGGTLFLDEIGELPRDAQARLLRVLQDGELRRLGGTSTRLVDVRLIAATHRDLEALTREGGFREDLYYRLDVVSLRLPPLRDRGDDAILLAQAALASASRRMNKPGLVLSDAACHAIRHYRWPGNVRELENALERAVILCDGSVIEAELLAIDAAADIGAGAEAANGADSLTDYFMRFVLENQDHFTETELAHRLGISRKSLWERRQRLNIPRRRTRKRGPRPR